MARARGSVWLPIALRIAAVAIALLVLAWIGRTAAARPTAAGSMDVTDRASSTGTEREGEGEAGSPPLMPAPIAAALPAALPAAPIAPPAAPGPTSGTPAHASPMDPVFINHAGVDELRRLPGVGPKRAEAILALRQRLGRFQRVEDLLRVKGVGRGAVKKWRPLVRLDAPAAEIAVDGGLR